MPTHSLPPTTSPPAVERRQTIDPWREWGITRDSLRIIISRDSLVQAEASRADSTARAGQTAYAAEAALAKIALGKALRESPWIKSADSDWSKSIAQGASTLDPKSALALSSILLAQETAELNMSEQRQLMDVFKVLGPLGRQELAAAVHRRLPESGEPLLRNRDSQGRTFLSNIHRLCYGPMDFRIGLDDERLSRRGVLLSILREAGRPAGIPSTISSACTANSAIAHIAETRPSEFSRIIRGLLSAEGVVTMEGGAELRRLPDALEAYGSARRKPALAEFVLTSTLMDFGARGSAEFKKGAPNQLILNKADTTSSGLTPTQFKRLLGALYGRKFKILRGESGLNEIFHLERYPWHGMPVMVNMLWSTRARTDGGQAKSPSQTENIFHAVRFLRRLPSGDVLVADPSDTTTTNNRAYDSPPRVIIDAPGHITRFSAHEFRLRFRTALTADPTPGELLERMIIDIKGLWASLWERKDSK